MSHKPKSNSTEETVHFIADPSSLPHLEVEAAQNDDEFLLPEEDFADESEMDETLESLKQALSEQEKKHEEELAPTLAESQAAEQKRSEERLAEQIAEDEALEQELQKEKEAIEAMENTLDPELMQALPSEPVANEEGELDLAEMESCIEALLFMMEKPVSAKKLRELLGPEMPLHYFQEALTRMKDRYQKLHHGVELVEVAHGYQIRTKPIRAPLAKKLAKIQRQRLSSGAMETLAIVAYKQPILKEGIDQIRGVDSSHFIRGLIDKKLIRIAGRSDLPGRPMVYETTQDFLEIFGLKNLEAMPSLREIESMVPSSQVGQPEEDPKVREMRKLVGEMKADTSTSLIYDPKEDEQFLQEIKERVKSIDILPPSLAEVEASEAPSLDSSI